MQKGREPKGASRVVGNAGEAGDRRRPQVEVIREPNPLDEDVLADPPAAD
jgi:hypothetical protein